MKKTLVVFFLLSSLFSYARHRFLRAGKRTVALCSFLVTAFLGLTSALAQDPSVIGQWTAPETWPAKAIHAQLFPTGKLLFWPNSGQTSLWDPVTDTWSSAKRSGENTWCSGYSLLADGQMFLAGGYASRFVGTPHAYKYNAFTDKWTQLPDMNAGRWYPTSTTLPNNDVLVISGQIDTTVGMNVLPQVWQTAVNSWRDLTTAQLVVPYYPYMFVAPNGKVFMAGPGVITRYLDVSGTGTWTTVANFNFGIRNWASAVTYDDGKILVTGGTTCDFYFKKCADLPTPTAETIDLNGSTPTWTYTAPMLNRRKNHNLTLLPDGNVFCSGGTRSQESPNLDSTDPAFQCEMWNPNTGQWSAMASITVFRGYHSIAALLPDGRVVSAGGKWGTTSGEIYSPPYLFKGARPTITSAPASVAYGQTFFVGTPDATSISKVTMIALSSVTHGFNMNQRIIRPAFSQASGGLNVTAPSSSIITPPGYYMLFILNSNGVPSVSNFVRIN